MPYSTSDNLVDDDTFVRTLEPNSVTAEVYSDGTHLLGSDETNFTPTFLPNTLNEFKFKPVDTITIGIFLILCSISLFVVSTVMPIECEVGDICRLNTMSLLLYLHCLFWGISLIIHQCIQHQHFLLRRRGYLEFYTKVRGLSRLPFGIISTWSTFLLTISTILQDYCSAIDGKCGILLPLKKSDYVMICIGLELALLIPIICAYLWQITKFNAKKALPDILFEDETELLQHPFGLNSLGNIDEELFQRQADLIQYFKEQNTMLRKTVSELNRQILNRNS